MSSLHLSNGQLVNMYRKMLLVRRFEQKVSELFSRGALPGFTHLYIGEEAIAVGTCENLNKDDFIASTHRPHGHLLAKGSDPKRVMAEIFGKRTGYCRGKGGSMHVTDMENKVVPSAIVGAGILIAVGAALSFKIRKENSVAVSFFGDGASNTGAFHEGLNMASIWKLPVVFVCENNLYAISVPSSKSTSVKDIAVRAKGYDVPGETVDGNDVNQVFDSTAKAIKRARDGEGPTFVECKTYRWHGHMEGDPELTYRTQEEIDGWKKKCPINRLEVKLLEEGALDSNQVKAISKEITVIIDDAVKFSEESSMPDPNEIEDDVFSREVK